MRRKRPVAFARSSANTEITYPREYGREGAATKLVTRLMTPRAKAYRVISFFLPRVKKKGTFLFPPVLRAEVLCIVPSDGDFVLVYLTAAAAELAGLLKEGAPALRVLGLQP